MQIIRSRQAVKDNVINCNKILSKLFVFINTIANKDYANDLMKQ